MGSSKYRKEPEAQLFRCRAKVVVEAIIYVNAARDADAYRYAKQTETIVEADLDSSSAADIISVVEVLSVETVEED